MNNAIAIGQVAGAYNQGTQSVAIGYTAGVTNQGAYAVALGSSAGQSFQSTYGVAIGSSAGNSTQGYAAIAIGQSAGQQTQGTNAVAIGYEAGKYGQGTNAIAVGYQAGTSNQPSNTIILNASDTELNGSTPSAFYVNPVRNNNTQAANLLTYNTGTSEITYNSGKTFIIDHPTDENKYLVHACLEGPESGVYYRGEGEIVNNETTTIMLPDYVGKFATDFTVQLTTIYTGNKNQTFQSTRVEEGSFKVYGDNGKFFWLVQGKRGDVDVEPLKSNTVVKGDGPYTWISTFHKQAEKI